MERIRLDALPEDGGKTVQRLLHERAPMPNSRARGLVLSGAVLRNGRPVANPAERVAAGDHLEVRHDPSSRYAAPRRAPRTEGFRVVHEEAGFVVVDKEPGVLTVPTATTRGDSLVERLEEDSRRRGFRARRALPVHRIDRYTSGLVVVARDGAAFASLRSQFASRRPERVYLAVAEGRVAADAGTLEHRLAEHPKSLKVRAVEPHEPGRWAASSYRVLERFPRATLLEVRLRTGRRNQIRVQLAADGHPLVGDVAYGRPSRLIDRTALHAWRLCFAHPATAAPLSFEAEPPEDFRKLLAALRRGASPAHPEGPPRERSHSPTRTRTPE